LAASIPAEDERYVLESQVRECFGRCAYTHKTHERMADRHARWLQRVKWAQIILSALTTAGAVGVIFSHDSVFFPYATLLLAVATLILNSYVKDVDPGQLAQKHREAASDIWNIREAYLSLLTDKDRCSCKKGKQSFSQWVLSWFFLWLTPASNDGVAF
jgi:hypothetical protein